MTLTVSKLTYCYVIKQTNKKGVRRALNKIGEPLFLRLLEVKKADTMAQSSYKREQKLEEIKQVREIYEQIKKEGECFQLKDLAVTGQDLITLGMKPGPEIGKMLNKLLDIVIDDPKKNKKETLLLIVTKDIF